jgi:hypothetical protein
MYSISLSHLRKANGPDIMAWPKCHDSPRSETETMIFEARAFLGDHHTQLLT